ncbi:hypothetical protein [Cohnella cellulosilytica]|uniref:hypothetical protein n=1 Tax=Cohnella cellulosilytica TaxID=986710 RepID=UPI00366E0BD8
MGNHLNVALFRGIRNARGIEVTLGSTGLAARVRLAFGVDDKNFAFTVNNLTEGASFNYTNLQRITAGGLDTIGSLPVSRVNGNDFAAVAGNSIKAVQGQNVQLFHNGVLKCMLYPTPESLFSLSVGPLYAGVSWRDAAAGYNYTVSKVRVFPKVIDRYMHLSLDDFISPLKDLTLNVSTYTSLFEQADFAYIKYLHVTYVAVFTLNLFYEDSDAWNLSSMTTKCKVEFRKNADWLKFAFHAQNASSNYGGGLIPAATALSHYQTMMTVIKSFSSGYNIDRVPRVGNIDTARLWKNAGARGFLTADDNRSTVYYLNSIQRDTMQECDDYFDEIEGFYFAKTMTEYFGARGPLS